MGLTVNYSNRTPNNHAPLTDRDAIIGLKNAQLEKGHSRNTRISYRAWMMRYRELRKAGKVGDLQGFLKHLSTVDHLNPKTVRQALNALKFYHEKVLNIEIAKNSLTVPRINPHRNIPVWLTHEEAMDLISRMKGDARLQAEMLYGTGSRITALLTSRHRSRPLKRSQTGGRRGWNHEASLASRVPPL